MSKLISDQVFARSDDSDTLIVEVVPAEAVFRPFQGRFIRNIDVARVSVFENYDEQAGRSTVSALGRMGDALHIDTRERTIRKYFLMKAGEPLDAETLADTERLLRRTRFILDAKIEVVPVEQSADSVDVLVVTRDNWSLGFDPRIKTARRYDFTVEERNLLGLGHRLRFDFDVDLDLNQQVGYTSTYTSDNLKGSFVLGEYRWRDSDAERSHRLFFERARLAPQIQYIGAVEAEYAEFFPRRKNETLESFFRGDTWLGRAFPLGTSPTGGMSRLALTPAARVQVIDYRDRPTVTNELNRGFRDRTLALGSLSLNRSRFQETRLIRGYGRTEDIPYGFLATVTGGAEFDEFETRPYFDAKASFAKYSGERGYVYAAGALGSFRRKNRWEDTAIDLGGLYFSPLGELWRFKFRHFASAKYTRGVLRRTRNQLVIDNSQGLIAVDGNDLRGDERLVLSFESVTFMPYRLLGFRFALFEFLSTGAVEPPGVGLLSQSFVTSAGIGLRIHNERLIFNPLELRFAFLLSGPAGTSVNEFRFGTSPTVDLPGLDPGAPSLVPYQ